MQRVASHPNELNDMGLHFLHLAFQEFLVSVKHQQAGLVRFLELAPSSAPSVRLPAVNYGGPMGDPSLPLVGRFRWHTGKLYWHLAAGRPEQILSVNTTSAWPEPPAQMANFFHPDDLRVNHYVDALGPRGSQVFKHEDPPEVLAWAVGRPRETSAESMLGRLVADSLHSWRLGDLELINRSILRMSPPSRVALAVAPAAEEQEVMKVLQDGFHTGDADRDGLLALDEFEKLALPSGWDAHLRRRNFHYIGLFLHAWVAESSAQSILEEIDQDEDEMLSFDEWSQGMLWLCRRRDLMAAAQDLLSWSKRKPWKQEDLARTSGAPRWEEGARHL